MEAFGSYLLLRVLGHGGMGVVHVARSRLSGYPVVALKKLRTEVSDAPSFQERFSHECELALRLRHPRVVRVIDAGEVDGVPYIASELILGSDLSQLCKRLVSQNRRMPFQAMIRIVLDTLAALDYVHETRAADGLLMKVVHRDVTPNNIIVGHDAISRLVDFGLAKSCVSESMQLTGSGVLVGTPKFMAPEVVRGAPSNPTTDIYQVGAVVYRMLAGRGPYCGSIQKVLTSVLTEAPEPLHEIRPDLPFWFVRYVGRLMAPDASVRPRSAREAGLILVDEARRHGALWPRVMLGRWLRRLFLSEWTRQTENYRKDCEVDVTQVAERQHRSLRAVRSDSASSDGQDEGSESFFTGQGRTRALRAPRDGRYGTLSVDEVRTVHGPLALKMPSAPVASHDLTLPWPDGAGVRTTRIRIPKA